MLPFGVIKQGWLEIPLLAGNRHLNSSGISQLAMFDYQRATRSFTRGSWTSIFWEPWVPNPRELGNSHTCGALGSCQRAWVAREEHPSDPCPFRTADQCGIIISNNLFFGWQVVRWSHHVRWAQSLSVTWDPLHICIHIYICIYMFSFCVYII